MPPFNRKNHIIKEGGGTAHEPDGSRPMGKADSREGGWGHGSRARPTWRRPVRAADVEGDQRGQPVWRTDIPRLVWAAGVEETSGPRWVRQRRAASMRWRVAPACRQRWAMASTRWWAMACNHTVGGESKLKRTDRVGVSRRA
jgi:hypothetical protein